MSPEPKAVDKADGKTLAGFINANMNKFESLLITDEFRGYNSVGKDIKRYVVNHSYEYANGDIHTNTIERFWSILKRAWYDSHHHYSRKFTNHYIAEACYKYNKRNYKGCGFGAFLELTVA